MGFETTSQATSVLNIHLIAVCLSLFPKKCIQVIYKTKGAQQKKHILLRSLLFSLCNILLECISNHVLIYKWGLT